MKKIFAVLTLAIVLLACKNSEEKSEATSETIVENTENVLTYRGEFIYTDQGAVLKGNNYIYGVTLDDKARELADKVAPIKKEQFDMVAVVVKGVVSKNPAVEAGVEAWEELITIKEIVEVSDKPAEADIKIEDKN